MTVSTECFICGNEAIGTFRTHKSHKEIPMCAKCRLAVLDMHREINKPVVKEVAMENIF